MKRKIGSILAIAVLLGIVGMVAIISPVEATIPGDINGDYKVDFDDLLLLSVAWGSQPGDDRWNENADLNGDGVINVFDLTILGQHYGLYAPSSDKALILAPYHSEHAVGYSDGLKEKLEDKGWTDVDYYKDGDVTIPKLDEWLDGNYGIIHITGHADWNELPIEHFDTEDARNKKYDELEKTYGNTIVKGDFKKAGYYIGINGDFIKKYCKGWQQHPLIYLEACYTGISTDLRDAFIDNGAGAYVGFDKEVMFARFGKDDPRRTAVDMSMQFYENFIDSGNTVFEAAQNTDPGEGDVYLTSHGEGAVTHKNLVFG